MVIKQFGFELSKIALNILLTEATAEGLLTTTVDEETGELRYWNTEK